MANKKVSQLTSKPSVLVTDLFPIADPSTGQLYKTTISDLGTAIGSGVSSVNGLVGAVVLDTDDIQELVSPTNKWFTDTRARAALSASSPLAYNSGTGVFSIPAATNSQNGYLTSTDWSTFNGKQAALSGTGFVKISGTTISYDNTSYLPLTGGTLTGTLIGTRAEFTTSTLVDGILVNNGSGRGIRIVNGGAGYGLIINNETASSAIPFVIQKSGLDKIYFTDSGAGNFTSSLTASSFVKSGGTSSQYLMADGSVSTLTNPVTGTGTSGIVAKFNGTSSITDSIIYDNGTRVSIGADVTTSNKFTAVASTTSSYAVVAQASGAANGFWATLSGTGEIFRGQTSGGSYFIINNGGNAFLNGNLNVGDFASTSYKLKVNGTSNFTGGFTGFEYNSAGAYPAYNTYFGAIGTNFSNANSELDIWNTVGGGFVFRKQTGASAQTALLTIASSGAATFSSSGNTGDALSVSNSAGNYIKMGGIASSTSYLYSFETQFNIGNSYSSGSLGFVAGNSEKMRITSAGNVGIGTTSPDVKLQVRNDVNGNSLVAKFSNLDTNAGTGAYIGFNTGYDATARIGALREGAGNSSSLIFLPMVNETPTDRMRITSGGYLKATTTGSYINTSGAYHELTTNANDPALYLLNHNGAGEGLLINLNTNGTTYNFLRAYSNSAGANRLIIYTNGNVVNANNSYGAISDIKLKENISDSTPKLADLLKVKVKNFNFIGSDDKQLGVIAQELEEVFPSMIDISPDRDVDGNDLGTVTKSVKYSVFVPMLIKAVQELSDKITTLENK